MEFGVAHTNRVVILVDMDCFYCQVEENLEPGLRGKPIGVVQYNQWRGGGLIAVNYPARAQGVTRYMRGNEAKAKCPEINLVSVPCVRGKADISKYRNAGKEVADVLRTFTDLLERASVDEAYLDVTSAVKRRTENLTSVTIDQLQNTHVVGYTTEDFLYTSTSAECLATEGNLKLLVGGVIAAEIRAAVYEKTGYKCSAGIAHNKILAKLACGMHKPNQQTILPQDSVQQLYENLPVKKIRSLGGKFGHEVTEDLGIKTMSELVKFSEKELVQRYDEKTGSWLYNIARGVNLEPVTTRLVSKSIGCCKKFPGRTALIRPKDVCHWLGELAEEMSERLEKDADENNRKAKQMVVSFLQEINREDISGSRTHPLTSYEAKKIAGDAFEVIKKNCLRADGNFHLKFLGISATRFEENKNVPDISTYFLAARETKGKRDKEGEEEAVRSGGSTANRRSFVDVASFVKNVGMKAAASDFREPEEDVGGNLNKSAQIKDNVMRDENNESNSSTFSAETEIVSLCGDENRPILSPRRSESDADSITDECLRQQPPATSKSTPASSYFTEFFNNLRDESLKSPADRNFDTSRYLEEEEDDPENDANPQEMVTVSEDVELCKDCNKPVRKSDLASHSDYHFALKLVQEENPQFKTKADVRRKSKSESKSTKRKRSDEKCLKLTSFLKTGGEEVAGETCAECNRTIPPGGMPSHLDYHVAKKLHLQINPVRTSASCKVQNLKAGRKKQGDNKIQSVASFFKPL